MKVEASDSLTSASLLSAVDEEKDECAAHSEECDGEDQDPSLPPLRPHGASWVALFRLEGFGIGSFCKDLFAERGAVFQPNGRVKSTLSFFSRVDLRGG